MVYTCLHRQTFVCSFVRPSVRSFVRSFVRSYFCFRCVFLPWCEATNLYVSQQLEGLACLSDVLRPKMPGWCPLWNPGEIQLFGVWHPVSHIPWNCRCQRIRFTLPSMCSYNFLEPLVLPERAQRAFHGVCTRLYGENGRLNLASSIKIQPTWGTQKTRSDMTYFILSVSMTSQARSLRTVNH